MKHCLSCGKTKPYHDFWKNKSTKDGFQAWCKECWKLVTSKRRNGPNRDIELRQRKNRNLIRAFNITLEEYEDMLSNQGGKCAICKKEPSDKKRLAVDHCHSKGHIRGILCENCNRGLGMFADDHGLLQNAIDYLVEYR